MQRAIFILIAVIITTVGTQAFPWLGIFGNPLPLAPVILVIASIINPSFIIPAGIAIGLSLDMSSAVTPGFWTFYYAIASLILHNVTLRGNRKWWWKLIWIFIAVILSAIYGQIQFPTIKIIDYWWEIVGIAAFAVAAVFLPCWFEQRREASI